MRVIITRYEMGWEYYYLKRDTEKSTKLWEYKGEEWHRIPKTFSFARAC